VRAFDPAGMGQAKPLLPELVYCDGPYACAEDAHAVVLVTEWEQFRALDLAEMKRRMASPLLIDLRNIYARADVVRHGFHYFAVGRPAPVQTQVECTPKMRHENNEEQ
jgi:UDPglucose 6-dehydrogenase